MCSGIVTMACLFPRMQHALEYILSFITSQRSASFCSLFLFFSEKSKSKYLKPWEPHRRKHTLFLVHCNCLCFSLFWELFVCLHYSVMPLEHILRHGWCVHSEHGCVLIKLYLQDQALDVIYWACCSQLAPNSYGMVHMHINISVAHYLIIIIEYVWCVIWEWAHMCGCQQTTFKSQFTVPTVGSRDRSQVIRLCAESLAAVPSYWPLLLF